MISKIINNKLLFIGIHIIFGFLNASFSWFAQIYGNFIILFSILIIFSSGNKNEEALVLSAYLVGSEVFIRMTGGFILYETGKYAVMLFLLLGMFLSKKKQHFSTYFIFYILLLLLGIIFTETKDGESIRKAITFNLSGPIVLGVTAFYLHKRPISREQLFHILFCMLLPLFSMIVYLYFRTPDLKEIVFGGVANFATSGGFGPNQVATAIGLGIFIISIFILLREKITGYPILDLIILTYFIYRGLLTFSRGGIITAAVAIIAFSFFYFLYKRGTLKLFFIYLITGGIFIFAIWLYTSNITGGMLDNRYSGKNARGVQKKDITSGRVILLENQLKSFAENPLGIGVGSGKFKRKSSGEKVTAISHNEMGRLIEEHGIVGLIILFWLLIIPFMNAYQGNNYQRGFIISFLILWFLTINHSAMRIAFPGFIYALSLIRITDNKVE